MAQLIKKFIGNDQVGSTKFLLEANTFIRGRSPADDNTEDIIKLSSVDTFGCIELGTYYCIIPPDDGLNGQLGTPNRKWADVRSTRVAAGSITCGSYEGTGSFMELDGAGLNLGDNAGDSEPALRLWERNYSFSVGIRAAQALGLDYTLTLPAAAPSAGQILQSDASGNLSWVNPAAGPGTLNKETFTLAAGDITNGYIDLANVALANSIQLLVKNAGVMLEGASHDYTVNLTGGAGGNTRITWVNDLATNLEAGDVLQVAYTY